jgi:cyclohexanecarboxylate-CoA ligase
LTIGRALSAAAQMHPDDSLTFAQVEGRTTALTLAELWENAQRTAGCLVSAGFQPGEPVVLQAPTDAVSTEIMIALWSLGTVPVPVAVTASPEEVGHIAQETASHSAIIAPQWRGRDLATELASNAASLGLERIVTLGHDGPKGTIPFGSLDISPIPTHETRPSQVACVLYTSGSTAAPKGVMHSHETLLSGLGAVPVDVASRMLATFPAGHVASLLGLLRPLTSGGTTVLMDRWSPRAAAELIEDYRITVSAGTPFFLSTLLDEAERARRDISSLKRFLVGAAAVPPSLVDRSESAGIVSWRTYGSTEHPAISAGGPDDPSSKRRLTDGRVGPGNAVRLIDENGDDVSPGQEGEVISRGPKQFLGYQDPSVDTDAFTDMTWFRTGDLARFDEDGYLVVTDRLKDIIIRGGENISAREIEDVLARHPSIQEVAVCAAPDAVWGEAVCAVVIVRPERDAPKLEDLESVVAAAGLQLTRCPVDLSSPSRCPAPRPARCASGTCDLWCPDLTPRRWS